MGVYKFFPAYEENKTNYPFLPLRYLNFENEKFNLIVDGCGTTYRAAHRVLKDFKNNVQSSVNVDSFKKKYIQTFVTLINWLVLDLIHCNSLVVNLYIIWDGENKNVNFNLKKHEQEKRKLRKNVLCAKICEAVYSSWHKEIRDKLFNQFLTIHNTKMIKLNFIFGKNEFDQYAFSNQFNLDTNYQSIIASCDSDILLRFFFSPIYKHFIRIFKSTNSILLDFPKKTETGLFMLNKTITNGNDYVPRLFVGDSKLNNFNQFITLELYKEIINDIEKSNKLSNKTLNLLFNQCKLIIKNLPVKKRKKLDILYLTTQERMQQLQSLMERLMWFIVETIVPSKNVLIKTRQDINGIKSLSNIIQTHQMLNNLIFIPQFSID